MKLLAVIEASVLCIGFLWVLVRHLLRIETLQLDTDNCFVSILCCLKVIVCSYLSRTSHNVGSQNQIMYRPGGDHGLWCCMLLPMALMAEPFQMNGQGANKQGIVEVYLLLSTVTDPVTWPLSNLDLLAGEKLLSVLGVILWAICVDVTTAGCILLFVFLCSLLTSKLPQLFPKSFTQGESVVISQLLMLIFWRISQVMISGRTISSVVSKPTCFAVMSFLGVFVSSFLCPVVGVRKRPLLFYVIYGVMGFAFVLPVLSVLLGQNPFLWLLEYVMSDNRRVFLFVWWLVCSVISIVMVWMQTGDRDGKKSATSTIVRKGFHVVAMAVCVPGLLLDADCFMMSSAVALGVLVILESIRFYQVPPMGKAIQSAYQVFLDQQDTGEIILTPLYLMMGCSLPAWISNRKLESGIHLFLYSGIMSLGVGDTMASVGGKLYGKHKWPESNKTYEGTVIAALSMILGVFLFSVIGVGDTALTPNTILAVMLTSLLEASTTQIDNLVLPLFMFGLLASS